MTASGRYPHSLAIFFNYNLTYHFDQHEVRYGEDISTETKSHGSYAFSERDFTYS